MWDASQHSFLGGVFPFAVAALGLAAAGALLWHLWRAPAGGDGQSEVSAPRMMKSMLWFAGLATLSWLFGFVVAITVVFAAVARRAAARLGG